MQIYLARNNVQAGPYTLEQLNNMLASGEVILDDLMWHEGMENWQRVGNMTGGAWFYQPNGAAHHQASVQNGNSVDRLYGRATSDSSGVHNVSDKLKKSPFNRTKHKQVAQEDELASVWSRILAVLIDQVLAILCLVPILSALNFDMTSLSEKAGNPAAINELVATIPSHLSIMSSLMILGLFAIQIVMLVKRGQSIGKLATGVRILDYESKKIPNITNLILIRTILTNLAYNLPYLGQFFALADLIVMIFDKEHRSIHDKLAKTYVVKADDSQLETESSTIKS
ncbi:RDD family protein [Psychrobacter sp. I-STPA10]|uniref:RDD family protein n=1 Tax=Psychrobacter sp. I-STPA10 TaxID=2585769 RepID=UPI001E56E0E2|nr:RDD family protein [Psychrobacter sp. I-STPA10]